MSYEDKSKNVTHFLEGGEGIIKKRSRQQRIAGWLGLKREAERLSADQTRIHGLLNESGVYKQELDQRHSRRRRRPPQGGGSSLRLIK